MTNYNLQLIKNTVKEIARMGLEPEFNNEAAHEMEDDLMVHVLHDIASGEYTLEECIAFATEVLKTKELDFTRWYA